MVYEFGFGKEIQKVDISDNISVRELTANKDIEFKAIDADIVNALAESTVVLPVIEGVLAEECLSLLRDFFAKARKRNK